MLRLLGKVLLLGAAIASSAVAQSSSSVVPPSTPAGTVLRAWLDAFNSADIARLAAYARQYDTTLDARAEMPFRDRTGGFQLLTVERSEPRRVEFVAKERAGETTAYGLMTVSDTGPLRVQDFRLAALGPNVSASALHIDAATRQHVIDGAVADLDSFYVFPDVAKRIADSLHARLGRGAYDGYSNAMSFAFRLNDDVRAIGHDKHMRVDYSARPLPVQQASASPPPDVIARRQKQMDDMNCGFVKVEQLEGNIGYLKFNAFADPELCAATASAAMNFVAASRALIIDLRENGGGSPAMVSYIASYLFSQRTHLNDLWTRRTNKTEEFWTRDTLPGRRFGGEKPVYVLTSSRTFSGGEEFTYDLKSIKRATIIGETTGGGAHPVSGHRIDEHFIIGVPFARAINPITHTNWEGTGVEPDIKVPAADALTTAEKLAREKTRS